MDKSFLLKGSSFSITLKHWWTCHYFFMLTQFPVKYFISSVFSFSFLSPSPSHAPLQLTVSFYSTSTFWGRGWQEVGMLSGPWAGLQWCTVLERTREARVGPLHHPIKTDWTQDGSLRMLMECLAWPGPYAFNIGTDVHHRPCALTPCIPLPCPPLCLKPARLPWTLLSGPLLSQL